MRKNTMNSRDDELVNLIEYLRQYNYIYVYGAGKVAEVLCNDLIKNNINIKNCVVSSIDGQKEKIGDVRVIQFDSHVDYKDSCFVLGMTLAKTSSVIKMFGDLGINQYVLLPQRYIDMIFDEFNRPKMEITTVVGCSVNCKYCPQSTLINSYYKDDKTRTRTMSFETYKTCIDKLDKRIQIFFVGMAEPFLNRDCLKMIEYAIDKGHDVSVYTTGVGLTLDDCKRLVKLPINSVILHAPDEQNYAHINYTDEYWDVIKLLINSKKENGSDFVDSCSAQGKVLREFNEINNGRVRVETYLHDRAGNIKDDSDKIDKVEYVEGKIYCCHCGKRLDHNILLPDGTVLLCCMDYAMRHCIGNLLYESYEDIINGKIMRRIKEGLEDGNVDLLCRTCTYAIQYK